MSKELAVMLGRIFLIFIIIEILLAYGLVWVALGSYFLAFLVTLFKPDLIDFKLLWGILFVLLLLTELKGG